MHFNAVIDRYISEGKLPLALGQCLQKFALSYKEALEKNNEHQSDYEPILDQFLKLVIAELQNPSQFEPYHQRVTAPIDYAQFGLDIIRPLIIFEESKVYNREHLEEICRQLEKGENVILLANHQTEPDPQAIALLLEKSHPQLAEKMIFVAGDRVITDPLAVPFSKGCNLLCIFSKKHIEIPPDMKAAKLQHNKKTMQKMTSLLSEGGNIIYVAPSGGRDRPNAEGIVEVAPFDPQSIEMFRLLAQQAQRPSHFYPLALATYKLLPPPSSVEKEIGERRHAQCTPIHLSFGSEIDMDNFPGCDSGDKRELRKKRADYIWQLVVDEYARFEV